MFVKSAQCIEVDKLNGELARFLDYQHQGIVFLFVETRQIISDEKMPQNYV